MSPLRESTYAELVGRIAHLVAEMHCRLDDEFTVEPWAKRFCMSPFHFQRVFTRIAGESCGFMFRRLRMERAAYELQHTSDRIFDIALRAGFNGPEAFSKAFRRSFGERASRFREAEWGAYWKGTPNYAHFTPGGTPEFRPIARIGTSASYRIESVPAFEVFGRRHFGYSGYIGKTLRGLLAEIEARGIDWGRGRMYTYANRLRRYIPVSAVETYVAVPAEWAVAEDLSQRELGGGSYLVVPFRDELKWLGDFWFRVWVEVLPASGWEPLPAPVYQEIRFGSDPIDPRRPQIDLFIPVREQIAHFGKR